MASLQLKTQMEFSLGVNELENYISYPVTMSITESVSVMDSSDKLQAYFKQMKERTSLKINNLEQRLDDCLLSYSQLQKSVDITYSRIKEDKKTIDIERYEDLLHYTFKQIEWTRSSRIMIFTDPEKKKNAQKYEQELSLLEKKLQEMQNSHNELLKQLQSSIEEELVEINQKYTNWSRQTSNIYNNFQASLLELEQQFDAELNNVEKVLKDSSSSVTQVITAKICKIEQQIQELSPKRQLSH